MFMVACAPSVARRQVGFLLYINFGTDSVTSVYPVLIFEHLSTCWKVNRKPFRDKLACKQNP